MFQEIYSIWVYFILDSQEMIVQKTKKLPKKSADFLCCFGVLNTIISWESKIKYTHIDLLEHIFSEVQLCIQKSIFNGFCGILRIWQIGCRVASCTYQRRTNLK